MMSGTRKAPPISTSSPRETTTSLRWASVLSSRKTAAALLLTTVAASAPVSSATSAETRSSRSPRPPDSRSYSSAQGWRAASTIAAIASSGSVARPRLVCSTVPVRLNTGRRFGRQTVSMRASTAASSAVSSGSGAPLRTASRVAASSVRTASVTTRRPCRAVCETSAGSASRRSTAGREARFVRVMKSCCVGSGESREA